VEIVLIKSHQGAPVCVHLSASSTPRLASQSLRRSHLKALESELYESSLTHGGDITEYGYRAISVLQCLRSTEVPPYKLFQSMGNCHLHITILLAPCCHHYSCACICLLDFYRLASSIQPTSAKVCTHITYLRPMPIPASSGASSGYTTAIDRPSRMS